MLYVTITDVLHTKYTETLNFMNLHIDNSKVVIKPEFI